MKVEREKRIVCLFVAALSPVRKKKYKAHRHTCLEEDVEGKKTPYSLYLQFMMASLWLNHIAFSFHVPVIMFIVTHSIFENWEEMTQIRQQLKSCSVLSVLFAFWTPLAIFTPVKQMLVGEANTPLHSTLFFLSVHLFISL